MPSALIADFAVTLSRFGVKAALPCQRALAGFIDDGDYYRHIRRVRRIYADRRRTLLEQLQQKLPAYLSFKDHQADMQVTARLKPGYDDREIAAAAQATGLLLSPLSAHYGDGPPSSGMLLGFCAYSEEEIIANVDKLAAVFKSNTPA